MNHDLPLVSVVIATYNMAKYLGEAVESVLSQTYTNVEIIIVDDGSTDDTSALVTRWANDRRVRCIRQRNLGQSRAKNQGISLAAGEYVAFLDADDRWTPRKLEQQIVLFNEHPDVAVVYSDKQLIDEYGDKLKGGEAKCPQGRITSDLLVDNYVNFGSAVVRREVLEEFGGFDETLPMSIDYDLWLRISTVYEFRCVEEPLLEYRIWSGQMSHKTLERSDCVLAILDKLELQNSPVISAKSLAGARSSTYVTRAYGQLAAGNGYLCALSEVGRALFLDPFSRRAWKCAVKIAIGRSD